MSLLYFLFSFFLLDHSSLVHSSIILWLILKIKSNEFFGCPCALAKLQEKNYFSEPCISETFWILGWEEHGHYPLPFHGFHILLKSAVPDIFQHALFQIGIHRRGGDGISAIQCICLHSLSVKKIYIDSVKLKSPSNFPVQIFFFLSMYNSCLPCRI